MNDIFEKYLIEMPLFAVLRGIAPDEAHDVAATLIDNGVRIVEVTLNSPEPYKSIEIIAKHFSTDALIGAGTVLHPNEVAQVKDAGGLLAISPHTDTQIITETKKQGLLALPGCFSPSEAFAALNAGADGLKFFPAEILSPSAIKAMRAVLPREAKVFVVGGVNADNMSTYVAAGANGFGAGSSLYKPRKAIADIAKDARAITANLRHAFDLPS